MNIRDAQDAYELSTEHSYGAALDQAELDEMLAADLMAPGASLDPCDSFNLYTSLEDISQAQAVELTKALHDGDWTEFGRILAMHSESYWSDMAAELIAKGGV